MFERYTENARRVIFFARYEASLVGSPEIESEHLLIGIMREGKNLLSALQLDGQAEEIRVEIEQSSKRQPKTSTSVDLPLTNECKRILAYGAEEAERLGVRYIGSEHLLLGILREEKCLAARVLHHRKLDLKQARNRIAEAREQLMAAQNAPPRMSAEAVPARPRLQVHIVEAATSKELLVYRCRSEVPRIGESIILRNSENAATAYRVQDVVWEFDTVADPDTGPHSSVRVMVTPQPSGS